MSTRGIGRGMLVLAWVGFLGVLTLAAHRWLEARDNPNAALAGSTAQTLVVQRNRQHHYVVPGKINGVDVTFLIDTGASVVAIPAEVAGRLSLEPGAEGWARTANGVTPTRLSRAEQVSVGGIRVNDVPVSVLPNAAGTEVLLGMSFLRHLDWQKQGDAMILSQP